MFSRKTITLLAVSIFLFIGTMSLVSCDKSQLIDIQDLKVSSYHDIGVKTDQEHGTYLVFKSLEDAKKVTDYLDTLTLEQMGQWESGIKGFESLRKEQIKMNLPLEKRYSANSMSTILNKSGYVMIGDKLYLDENNGKSVYIIEGTKKIYFTGSEQKTSQLRSSATCKTTSNTNYSNTEYCGVPSHASRKVTGMVTYSAPWIGNKKVIVKTLHETIPCNGYGYSTPVAAENIGFEVGCSISADGTTVNLNAASYLSYAVSSIETVIAQGSNLCVGYCQVTHIVKPYNVSRIRFANAML